MGCESLSTLLIDLTITNGIMVEKERNVSYWDPYWTFPENDSFEVRYLCWRACGETRQQSTILANEGYMPASWWMLYRDDGN
jgi:hypothetical protein